MLVDDLEWLHRALPVRWIVLAVLVVSVTSASALVALAPHRTIGGSGLRDRVEGRARRPTWLRLVPLLAGTLQLIWVRGRTTGLDAAASNDLTIPFLTGAAMLAVGLILSLSWVTTGMASLIVARSPSVALLLAARRQLAEPGSSVRLVTGLVVSCYIVTAAMAPMALVEQTDQFVAAEEILDRGPQPTVIIGEGIATERSVRLLSAVPGVIAVARSPRLSELSCLDGDGNEGSCGNAYVFSCDAAARLLPGLRCRGDEALDVRLSAGFGPDNDHLVAQTEEGQRARLPLRTVHVSGGGPARIWQLGPLLTVLPSEVLSTYGLTTSGAQLQVYSDATGRADAAVDAWAERQLATIHRDWKDVLPEVQGYRLLVWTLATVILGVGLMTVMVSAVDRAVDRRRPVALLVAAGTPPRVLRAAQFLQVLLALLPGLVMAMAAGWLVGLVLIHVDGRELSAPWSAWANVALVSVLGTVVVSGVTVAGVGARLSPQALRRE